MKLLKNITLLFAITTLLSGCANPDADEDSSSSHASTSETTQSSGSSSESESGSDTSSSGSSSESESGSDTSSSSSIPEGAIDATSINKDTDIALLVNNPVDVTNYYKDVNDSLSGDSLKSKLSTIISGSKSVSYDSLEDYMRIADRDWHRSSNVDDANPYMILLYYTSNDVESKQQLWNHYHTSESKFGIPDAQQSWDKEHIWAKSNGSLSGDSYSDLHHLRASDRKNNNTRSNYPLANVVSNVSYIKDFAGNNASKLGTSSKGSKVCEPLDQYKGDVARALLYMTVRYSNLQLTNGKDDSGGKWGYLDELLAWNLLDQPDEFEIRRNSLVQKYQGNRNPFIDHPDYACRIYPNSASCK